MIHLICPARLIVFLFEFVVVGWVDLVVIVVGWVVCWISRIFELVYRLSVGVVVAVVFVLLVLALERAFELVLA